MIDIRPATVDEMLVEAYALFEEHWDEIALNKDVMVLKPYEEKYRAAEEQGTIFILAAWQDDVLIGYSVNFVTNHLHYADMKLCSNDLLFVKKEYRQGRAGMKLMKDTEAKAKSLGCQLMLWHAKESTPLADILPRMKYRVQDIIFSKEL